MGALAKADADRIAVEASLNELQGYSVDLVDKLEDEEFQAASTAEEREKLGGECAKVSDWLDEEAGVLTPVEEFQSKLKILKEMAAPVMARLREHRERPEALDVLKQSLNSSKVFLEKSREMVIPPKPKEDADEVKTEEKEEESKPEEVADDAAKEDDEKEADGEKKEKKATKDKKKGEIPDEGIFTSKELELLEKKIGEVEKWRDDKLEEQTAMPLSEMPKLTVSMIKSKIQDLDSEVQLLIGNARMIRAERERAKRKAEEEKKKEEEKAKKEEEKAKKDKKKKKKEKDSDKEKKEKEETQEEPTEAPVSDDVDSTDRENSTDEKPEPTVNEDPDTTSNDKDTDEPSESDHTEL